MDSCSREIKLMQFANQNLGQLFQWGKNDCNILAMHWADYLTGSTIAREFVGQYDDRATASEFAESLGYNLERLLRTGGWVPVPTVAPRAGDIVLIQIPGELFQRGHIATGTSRMAISSTEDDGVFLGQLPSAGIVVMRSTGGGA